MVKFDGKHWTAKRTRAGPLRIHSYDHVADITKERLGEGGIVAVPNARPDEYRFEEFRRSARESGDIEDIADGRVFHDRKRDVYFMKAQEIRTQLKDIPLVFLVYNISLEENLRDDDAYRVLESAQNWNCIVGITGPSCVDSLEGARLTNPNLLASIDFFVGYSSGSALTGANMSSLDYYRENIRNKAFTNQVTYEHHNVGVIAVSGGHRTPHGIGEYIFGQTIGRSYTTIDRPSDENFMENLRTSLRTSQLSHLIMRPTIAETLRHAVSIKVIDKFRK